MAAREPLPLAPLLPEPRPVLEPLPDLALEAALDRLVERAAAPPLTVTDDEIDLAVTIQRDPVRGALKG